MKALQDFLRPEFINRVDEIVYFNQLTEDNFKAIAALMLQELQDSPGGEGHHLHLGGQPAGLSGEKVLFRRLRRPEFHMVHLYCGEGKGKTTAAMGLALRMAGGAGR